MPVPTANISMDAIAVELKIGSSPIQNNSMETIIYVASSLAGSPSSGSFHNLNMALPFPYTDTFKDAIYDKYAAQDDMGLKNWAAYDHDAPVMLDVAIYNNSGDVVQYDLEISDTPGSLGSGVFTNVASGVLNPSNSLTVAFLNTGVAAYSAYGVHAGLYFINARFIDISFSPTRCFMTVTSSSDTDGVGTGTTRDNYTLANGGVHYDIVPGPFDLNLISGDVWNSLGDGIPWNKRTSFVVEFTP